MRRVVITGLGMVTPLGSGVETTWSRLINAESGIRPIVGFDVSDLPAKIGGQVPFGDGPGALDLDTIVAPKDQKKMDTFILYAIAASEEAIRDAEWMPTEDEEQEGLDLTQHGEVGYNF